MASSCSSQTVITGGHVPLPAAELGGLVRQPQALLASRPPGLGRADLGHVLGDHDAADHGLVTVPHRGGGDGGEEGVAARPLHDQVTSPVSPGEDRAEVEGRRRPARGPGARRTSRPSRPVGVAGVGLGGRVVDEGDDSVDVGRQHGEPDGVQQVQLVDVSLHIVTSRLRRGGSAAAHCAYDYVRGGDPFGTCWVTSASMGETIEIQTADGLAEAYLVRRRRHGASGRAALHRRDRAPSPDRGDGRPHRLVGLRRARAERVPP